MIEVVNVEHKTVLEGETRIAIDTDDGLYIVIVEWVDMRRDRPYTEANITRVQRVKKGESKWYENGEWENIPNWDAIEEKVWEVFEQVFEQS